MSVRKTIPYNNGVYFITFTCARWLPLFKICNAYNLVCNWFNILKAEGHYIIGYVIMPHHVHALIAFKETGKSINSIVGTGKRFMAYELVDMLKAQHKNLLLGEMAQMVNNTIKSEISYTKYLNRRLTGRNAGRMHLLCKNLIICI